MPRVGNCRFTSGRHCSLPPGRHWNRHSVKSRLDRFIHPPCHKFIAYIPQACLFIHRQQKRQFILRPDRPDIQKFSFRLRFRLLFVQLRIVLPLFRKFILVQELIIKQQLVILPQFRQFFIQQKLIRFIIQRKQEQRRILQRRRKQEQRLLGQALSNPETANACRTHINTSEK